MSQEHFRGGVYTAALGSSSVFNVFFKNVWWVHVLLWGTDTPVLVS